MIDDWSYKPWDWAEVRVGVDSVQAGSGSGILSDPTMVARKCWRVRVSSEQKGSKMQRENDELRGNSFLGHLGVMLHADTMLGSETPGSRGGSKPGQGGTREG